MDITTGIKYHANKPVNIEALKSKQFKSLLESKQVTNIV